ncbi:MAG TPA: ABC transporter substrate-binding protein [Beijerinckiaceae bacterium]|jgi:putative ABC transport system substrate-binding protein
MRRREVIALLGAVGAFPLCALAQPSGRSGRIARVGILDFADAQDVRAEQFRQALKALGYVEGQNLALVQRFADGQMDRLPGLAAELLGENVDVMIAIGPATWAAKRATTTVPIVIAFSGDPVRNGMVPNLARPGGNITGFSYMSTELAGKRVELLHQAFPSGRIGILYNPDEPATVLEMAETESAARALGAALQPLPARHPDELESAFAIAASANVGALLVFSHGFAVLHERRIIETAARQRLPVMYGWRDFVDKGGLLSYGPDIGSLVRKAATYVDRIVKGEKPGDLPVEQPTKFELVINLKTAKSLGLTIPPSLLARADEVIE